MLATTEAPGTNMMTDAEFRTRYQLVGLVAEGSGVATELVRDKNRVLRMAHRLGEQTGSGSKRLAAVNLLPPEAQTEIIERCLVDGVWVLITRNIPDFVDFERWLSANEGPPTQAFDSNVFGPRLDRGKTVEKTTKEAKEAPQKERPREPDPRPTMLFGPELKDGDPISPSSARRADPGAVPSAPVRKPGSVEQPAASVRPAPGTGQGPRVFWRDLKEVVSEPPTETPPLEPVSRAVPPTVLEKQGIDFSTTLEAKEAVRAAYPTPVSTYKVSDPQSASAPTPLNSRTGQQSLPRVPPAPRSAERFTEVVVGRRQAELSETPAGGDAAEEEDQDSGIPKWAIITMVVVSLLAVILIVVSFFT